MSPKDAYKDKPKLVADIRRYMSKYGNLISDHNERIADYFEVVSFCCFSQYYRERGWQLYPENLNSDEQGRAVFRHKCGPTGIPENFSFFRAVRQVDGASHEVEIRQNIRVASVHTDSVYYIPDVVALVPDCICETRRSDFHRGTWRLFYAPNESMISFAECKHMVPFAGLCATFIGMVHELQPECLDANALPGLHLAPALFVSGVPKSMMAQFREDLRAQYPRLNFFFNVFGDDKQVYQRGKGARSVDYR